MEGIILRPVTKLEIGKTYIELMVDIYNHMWLTETFVCLSLKTEDDGSRWAVCSHRLDMVKKYVTKHSLDDMGVTGRPGYENHHRTFEYFEGLVDLLSILIEKGFNNWKDGLRKEFFVVQPLFRPGRIIERDDCMVE